MQCITTDVLIIGAGAAGLVCALDLEGRDIVVVAKAPAGAGSSSAWAQGGIAAAVGEDDHPKHHMKDTLDVAVDLACDNAVRVITHEGPDLIKALIDWGVNFDRKGNGKLSLGREAAHSFRRVLHANGDSTGKEIMRALGQAVSKQSNTQVMDDVTAYELVVRNGRVVGALGTTKSGEDIFIQAQAVVLATGGIGSLFGYTTNPVEACGEGIAMAARAGAKVADMEFVQFHPTAIDVGLKPMPLATEALRGEGAHLIDDKGIRFMPSVHKDAELAPRDVVARAIWRKIKSGQKVYLDCREAVGEKFEHSFPTVFAYCQDAGIDPRIDPIPVTPAAHYHMGGVDVDLNGKTSIEGLWAVGEVASTGVHGANRLASNSLLEAVVFGRRVANDIVAQKQSILNVSDIDAPLPSSHERDEQLSALLYGAAGVERHETGLRHALKQVVEWEQSSVRWSPAFYNKLLSAKMILVCALNRKESRGGHFRSDYLETNDVLAQRTKFTLTEINQLISDLNLEADTQGTENSCQTQA